MQSEIIRLENRQLRNHLQQVRESKVNHTIHPGKLKGNIWPNQIITNKEARCKAFLLALHNHRIKAESMSQPKTLKID
jgi:hypothetical protein